MPVSCATQAGWSFTDPGALDTDTVVAGPLEAGAAAATGVDGCTEAAAGAAEGAGAALDGPAPPAVVGDGRGTVGAAVETAGAAGVQALTSSATLASSPGRRPRIMRCFLADGCRSFSLCTTRRNWLAKPSPPASGLPWPATPSGRRRAPPRGASFPRIRLARLSRP